MGQTYKVHHEGCHDFQDCKRKVSPGIRHLDYSVQGGWDTTTIMQQWLEQRKDIRRNHSTKAPSMVQRLHHFTQVSHSKFGYVIGQRQIYDYASEALTY